MIIVPTHSVRIGIASQSTREINIMALNFQDDKLSSWVRKTIVVTETIRLYSRQLV
jgi:hypothetical protein